MVSIPAEKTQYAYMSYITTYPPSGAHVFNTVWTALHMLQERIHALHKSPRDISRSPHCSTYCTIGIVLKQTSS
jgi:hypothetical protein